MTSPDSIESLATRNEQLEEELRAKTTEIEQLKGKITSLEFQVQSLTQKNELLEKKVDCLTSDEPKKEEDFVSNVTKTAFEVANEQFLASMVYEETSGLYYDYKTGYYYDAKRSLYYDGQNGIYYSYNYDTKSYQVHSRVEQPKDETPKKGKIMRKRSHSASTILGQVTNPIEKSCYSAPASPYVSTNDEKDSLLSVLEEGEISDSEESCTQEPCIRLIVAASDESEEQVGTLFLVTCQGGTVGREGDHDVLLSKEIGCSKTHATITFERSKYYLSDSNSRNGTFVNDKRLKKRVEIGHGSRIQIGNTRLDCHVHPGLETCLECEPGLLKKDKQATHVAVKNREKERKKEMRRLRNKFGVYDSAKVAVSFNDRSASRRLVQGSDNPFEKTASASTDSAIESSNKGFKMLSKMGWKEGQGLGSDNQGRANPVQVNANNERAGLGASTTSFSIDKKSKDKTELWLKTQKRFQELKSNCD